MSMLTTMKGIPLAYNKDMQEDKELTFDAIDTVKGCLALFNGMLSTMRFKKRPHGEQCKERFHECNGRQPITLLEKAFRSAMHMALSAVSFCTALTKESPLMI